MGRPRNARGDNGLTRRRLLPAHCRGRRHLFELVGPLAVAGLVAAGLLATAAPGSQAALPWLAALDTEGTNYQTEPSSMTFTITLSSASAVPVTVDYSTINYPDETDDYVPASGTLTFAPGDMSKTVEITLLPEPGTPFEFDEAFFLDLSNPQNATMYKARATGIIHFDGRPKPEQVNVTAKGDGDQCVKTVDSDTCEPLTGESQFEIDDVTYINPGRRAIELYTTEGIGRFFGSPFGIDKLDAEASGTGQPVLLVKLRGGNFGACKNRALSSTSSTSGVAKGKPKPQSVRRLWGKGKGRFRTRGRYSSGTVRGTWWLTSDRCDGTRTLVRDGVVSVYDFVLKKHVKVATGQSYLASPSQKP